MIVSDIMTRRFTLISPDRKFVRTVSWLPTITMAGKVAGQPPRFRSPLTYTRYADGGHLVSASLMDGSPQPAWPGGEKPGSPVVRVDSTGAFVRLIVWRPEVQCTVPFDAGRGGRGFASIPFCAMPIQEVSANGDRYILSWVEHGTRPAYRVAAFRMNGDTAFNRTYDYEPIAITKAEKDSAIASRSRNPQLAAAMEKATLPDTRAPLLRILPGRDETTWLEVYTGTGDRIWHVLDASGAVTGRLKVPRNVELKVTSATTIWATETDDDGLQHIVRFRVSR
jgi:hypothetical protein